MTHMTEPTLLIKTDGGARGNPGPAALGVVVFRGNSSEVLYEQSAYLGKKTNNEAEYLGFIASVEWLAKKAADLSLTQKDLILWKLDSRLVVEQLLRNWKIKQPHLRQLAEQAWQLLAEIPAQYDIKHIPRADNKAADALVNQALDSAQLD